MPGKSGPRYDGFNEFVAFLAIRTGGGMKAVFYIDAKEDMEIVDPINNIERLRRMRNMNFRRVSRKGEDGVSNILSMTNKRMTFRAW